MKGSTRKIFSSKAGWLIILAVLIAVNFLAYSFRFRIDLTKEKRYTLSKPTIDLLRSLQDEVQIDIFLTGDLASGFRKLANSTQDFMSLLKDRNASRIQYRFISPEDPMPGTRVTYADSLMSLGAIPINLTVQKEASQSSNIIFPVALLNYQGKQSLVNLYPGASGRISQEEINSAEALMEYQFARALDKLVRDKKPGIAYMVGNGEPTDARAYDIDQVLGSEYDFRLFDINRFTIIPEEIEVLMCVKPVTPFTEEQKLKIDQFVMRGGKLLWFIDNLYAEQDSLSFKPETIAFDRNLNLTDLLFRYGVRINIDLVMDLQCDYIPFVVGGNIDNPQYEFLRWNYFPLLSAPVRGSVNKNLGYVASKFVNSIDTIATPGIGKTPLLVSSSNSRKISTPALISLNENKNVPEDEKFRESAIPVAMMLEGNFTSLYRNRISRAQMDSLGAAGQQYRAGSEPTRIIIVADGDIVLNDVIPDLGPLPMGWNKYTYSEYQKQSEYGRLFVPVANREFLISCVDQLVNSAGINETRNKDIVLRLLDTKKIREQKTTWQLLNIALPVVLIILFGLVYQEIRKRKYTTT